MMNNQNFQGTTLMFQSGLSKFARKSPQLSPKIESQNVNFQPIPKEKSAQHQYISNKAKYLTNAKGRNNGVNGNLSAKLNLKEDGMKQIK